MEDKTLKKICLWIYFSPLLLMVGTILFGLLIKTISVCTLSGNLAFGDDYYKECLLFGMDFAPWLNRNSGALLYLFFVIPWMFFGGIIIWGFNVIEGRKK